MKRVAPLGAALFCSVVLFAASPAHADLELEGDAPRVFSIQERPYRLHHEFQLGVGILPLDAFYVGYVLGASYTYHFSDFWAWEIASGNYSLNRDTSLEQDLLDKFGVQPVRGGGERIKTFLSTNLIVKPLFGKLALLNSNKIFAETFFTIGGGPFLKGDNWRFAANAGLGIRFWASGAMSVRFDIRDYLLFEGTRPENTLMFMLSASLNVGSDELDEESADEQIAAGGSR